MSGERLLRQALCCCCSEKDCSYWSIPPRGSVRVGSAHRRDIHSFPRRPAASIKCHNHLLELERRPTSEDQNLSKSNGNAGVDEAIYFCCFIWADAIRSSTSRAYSPIQYNKVQKNGHNLWTFCRRPVLLLWSCWGVAYVVWKWKLASICDSFP